MVAGRFERSVVDSLFSIRFEENTDEDRWDSVIGASVDLTLSLLLVFRLNRAAHRWWTARRMWGEIVGIIRHMVSGVMIHGHHDCVTRDVAIAWLASFGVATMHFLRGDTSIPPSELAGVLGLEQTKELGTAKHPPLCAGTNIRRALADLFDVDQTTPAGIAFARSQRLNLLEAQLNSLLLNTGGLERIKATPLPLVYVSHLRTFLLFYLLSLPYIWENSWGWATIPIVGLTAFAMLQIEGISQEVEEPFDQSRSNHLNMDAYCQNILDSTQYLIGQCATRRIVEAKN
eukprot:CAMPEP_0118718220 /NCGR_PEP_ID=MMETSP0800-20121206/28668_1 /TAXON_ID=210618 ORGANISM="Striatella unipunctata, Strain CCMP2910" /NCGR_SAMPLE_ID=MMETSP0800 /ASSEMBLY_ACC=CAM_ASM_000638 /LENGTH=287 /DNA_ID=CAMNT_0006625193 /DNA_START=318 /DNA_END=1180 /DNA_ORIENTATION=+